MHQFFGNWYFIVCYIFMIIWRKCLKMIRNCKKEMNEWLCNSNLNGFNLTRQEHKIRFTYCASILTCKIWRPKCWVTKILIRKDWEDKFTEKFLHAHEFWNALLLKVHFLGLLLVILNLILFQYTFLLNFVFEWIVF